MLTLKQIAERYTPAIEAGGGKPSSTLDKATLVSDLETVHKTSGGAFHAAMAMLVILFLLLCGLVIYYRNNTTAMTAILSASGLSIMGIVSRMIKLWKEKVASDLLIALAKHSSEKEIGQILNLLKPRL